MHRSGTSLLVGLLELHGFQLGGVSNKTSALKPTGTKESLEVRKINNQLFMNASSDWMNPKVSKQTNHEMALKIKQAANYFNAFSQWAIKDPRMLFTYNLWREHLPKHKLIGAYRKPLEVAQSLQIKNGIPISDGLEIWKKYNYQLLKIWKKSPFPIIEFSANKQLYLTQFKQIANHLNLNYQSEESSHFYQHKNHQLKAGYLIPEVYMDLARQLEQLTQ